MQIARHAPGRSGLVGAASRLWLQTRRRRRGQANSVPRKGKTMMHSDSELITRLAAELARQMRLHIPIEINLWDIAAIAAYLKRSESVVRKRMACLPDFPKAIRLPSTKTARGRPSTAHGRSSSGLRGTRTRTNTRQSRLWTALCYFSHSLQAAATFSVFL